MKKFLSLFLAIAMLLTVVVMPAIAIEGTTVVYYVNGEQDGEAVTELVAGEVYSPDRMPTAATEEGKYFVGWADSTGKIVSVDGLTLAEGENKLTAVYKDYLAINKVDLSNHVSADLTSNIGFIKNGEYLGQIAGRTSGAPSVGYVAEDGEEYLEVKTSAANSGGTMLPLADADGDVIQAKWNTKYTVKVIFRIPTNENVVSLGVAFGGKIYNSAFEYAQAPHFRAEYSNAPGFVKLGSYWSTTSGYAPKWHDHGGWIYEFPGQKDNVANQAEFNEWQEIVFEGTTAEFDENYLPFIGLYVYNPANKYNAQVQIKSVTVIETDAVIGQEASVEYVENGETVATVDGLTSGDAYNADRMPAGEAPADKTFAGWQDENGQYVLKDTFTLLPGVNKLYASYVDYVGKVSANLLKNSSFVAMPSLDANGENYLNYAAESNGYCNKLGAMDDTGYYAIFKNSQAWAARVGFNLKDDSGAALQIKPGAKYTVTFTYRLPEFKGKVDMAVGVALTLDKREYIGEISGTVTKTVGSLTASGNEEVLPLTSTGWTYIWHKNGHHAWAIQAAAEEWQTATYTFTAPTDLTGYLPTIVAGLHVPANSEIHIKAIDVLVDGYVAPATVTYLENGEKVATVKGLKDGEFYAPDRMPTTEAPAGKYFAGWADKDGKLVAELALVEGENLLNAVYKDYVYGTNVSTDLLIANLPKTGKGAPKVLAPSVVDGVYSGVMPYTGWASVSDASDETGDYITFTNGSTWGNSSLQLMHDADGVALMAQPETQYSIDFTYRVAKTPETYAYKYETWKESQSAGDRANFYMYMNVGMTPTIRDNFQSNAGNSSPNYKAIASKSTWYDHGPGFGFWSDIAPAGGEWVTETFTITTKTAEEYEAAGMLPIFTYYVGLPNNQYQLDVKSIVINQIGYKAPASVAYYENGEQVGETVADLSSTDVYVVDRKPTAEAPAGKFFAGWFTNEECTGAPVTEFTLAEGENKLYAGYADYLGKANAVITDGAKAYYLFENENGFYGSFTKHMSGYGAWTFENGIAKHTLATTWSQSSLLALTDKNGVALRAEQGKTYKVTFDIKGNTIDEAALAADYPDYEYETPVASFNVGSGFEVSYNEASDAYIIKSGTALKNYCPDGGVGTISVPRDNEWHTVTYYFNADKASFAEGVEPFIGIRSVVPALPNPEEGADKTKYGYYSNEYRNVIVEEVTADAFAESTLWEGKISYIKVADKVEAGESYAVTVRYKATTPTYLCFMTAAADDVTASRAFIGIGTSGVQRTNADGYEATMTTYISVDRIVEGGEALYMYVNGEVEGLTVYAVNVVRMTNAKGEALVSFGGTAMLNGVAEDATQALRFFYNYDSTNEGANIVWDGKEFEVKQRGFLVTTGEHGASKQINRDSVKNDTAVIDVKAADLSKCWSVEANENGSDNVTFSAYVSGLAAENGTYNSSNEIYVQGYIVIQIYGVNYTFYGDSVSVTVQDVADALAAQ